MILGHLFGLYTHPKQEWRAIDKEHEGVQSSLSHILLIALLPPTFASSQASLSAGELASATQYSLLSPVRWACQ